MARLNREAVLGMLFDPDFDSGGESDIEEDQAFPLPQPEDVDSSPPVSPRSSYSLAGLQDSSLTQSPRSSCSLAGLQNSSLTQSPRSSYSLAGLQDSSPTQSPRSSYSLAGLQDVPASTAGTRVGRGRRRTVISQGIHKMD